MAGGDDDDENIPTQNFGPGIQPSEKSDDSHDYAEQRQDSNTIILTDRTDDEPKKNSDD